VKKLFCSKVFERSFLQVGFVIFWRNNIGACKLLVKLTTGVKFNQCSMSSFYAQIPKAQKDSLVSVFLCFWDLRAQKLLVEH
jgi:hypothetical protein